jgi:hypothetical protein
LSAFSIRLKVFKAKQRPSLFVTHNYPPLEKCLTNQMLLTSK